MRGRIPEAILPGAHCPERRSATGGDSPLVLIVPTGLAGARESPRASSARSAPGAERRRNKGPVEGTSVSRHSPSRTNGARPRVVFAFRSSCTARTTGLSRDAVGSTERSTRPVRRGPSPRRTQRPNRAQTPIVTAGGVRRWREQRPPVRRLSRPVTATKIARIVRSLRPFRSNAVARLNAGRPARRYQTPASSAPPTPVGTGAAGSLVA
jgi:hypothetical protein